MRKLCALLLCLMMLVPTLALAWEPPAEQPVTIPFPAGTPEEIFASREDCAMVTVTAATNVLLLTGEHPLDASKPSYTGYFMNELYVMYFDGTEYIYVTHDVTKPDVFTFEPFGESGYGVAQLAMWESCTDFRDNIVFMLTEASYALAE
ncbi:MAG: hypothetical protein IKK21_01265 [Clostridia bacterium]|nr:hypothetical protein [Clostridia bacterium]